MKVKFFIEEVMKKNYTLGSARFSASRFWKLIRQCTAQTGKMRS